MIIFSHDIVFLQDIDHAFLPGDTIGILPSNPSTLVSKLLLRLNLESVADKPCNLHLLESTIKRNPKIPKHLPRHSTLRSIFTNNVDLHTPAKKLFLKSLLRFVGDPREKARLEKIASPSCSTEYLDLVGGTGATFLGLLEEFPSCSPPIGAVLEYLPPLQARSYSIASSPLQKNCLDITFFITIKDDGEKGICTGYLEDLIQKNSKDNLVPFYFRQPKNFTIPEDIKVPIILIATGTGISPFRGFLQHRFLEGHQTNGEIWLFYGCRYQNKDYLFKEEIDEYIKKGIISKINLAFSREGEEKNYVQKEIGRNAEEFINWIQEKEALVYVCGDPKTTLPDVKTAIVDILIEHCDVSCINADYYFEEMEFDGRFLVDTWI